MRARDRAGLGAGPVRQRPHAGIGVADRRTGQPGPRQQEVGLLQQVVDLGLGARGGVEVAVEPVVGGTDQVPAVPRDHQDRPVVRAGLVVDGDVRRTGERVDHEVRALGATDEPGQWQARGHLVDPRPRRVDHDGGPQRRIDAADAVAHRHAGRPAAVGLHPRHLGVGQGERPGVDRREQRLQDEPLGEDDLAVVVAQRAGEALAAQRRQLDGDGLPVEAAVPRHRLAHREGVEGHHAGPEHPGRLVVVRVQRHDEGHRRDQVRRDVQQPLAVVQRLVDQRAARRAPGTAGPRGSAGWTRRTCRSRRRPCPRPRPTARAGRRPARSRRR